MNDREPGSAWERYRYAKKNALEQAEEPQGEPMTLDELEAAIAQTAASSGIPETGMPPRSVVHPSKRGQGTKLFYRLLLFLFILLVGGLLWWGNKHYGA
ncbi:hypothetical protein ACFPVX_01050 [Cohnella faecalis]|uniref:Uncharacterized protein n=1 Tax=Cohnella faecalis TaxID=2315694 RepID=A0A398CMM4_9BACL|nr:hypothetical protein [Cohnella faecalis]RIE04616.1 hypothetical protein D3H35_03740 [Cohnella faecalis]